MTQQATIEATPAAEPKEELDQVITPTLEDDETLIADELLVEEVSIDGMCGVY
jgi:mycofactocin precursor